MGALTSLQPYFGHEVLFSVTVSELVWQAIIAMSDGDYRFCPYCATALQVREIYQQRRPVCPQCEFVHFLDPKVAVVGLVIHHGRVLLIQRAINPEKGRWALPGGYMDAGEMPQAALQRELMEEVNLAVSVTELIELFPMITNRAKSPGIVLAYRAMVANPDETELCCADDAADAGWFLPAEIPTDLAFESTQALLDKWLMK